MHRMQCRNWCVIALIVALIVWVPFALVTGFVAGIVLLFIVGVCIVAEYCMPGRKGINRRRKVPYCYTSADLLEVLDDAELMTEKEIRQAMHQRAKSLRRINPLWEQAPSHPLMWSLLDYNVEETRQVERFRRELGGVSSSDGNLWRYRRNRYVLPRLSDFPHYSHSVRPN